MLTSQMSPTDTSRETPEDIPQEEDALSYDPSGKLKFPVESTCSFSHLEGEHPIQIEVDLEATSQAPPPPSWHAEVFTGPQNKVSKNTTKPEAKPNLMVTPPPKTAGQPGTHDPTMHAEPLLLPGTDRKERKGSLPQMCPSTGFLKPPHRNPHILINSGNQPPSTGSEQHFVHKGAWKD